MGIRRIVLFVFIVSAAAVSRPAIAQSVVLRDPGAISCGTWTTMRTDPHADAVFGYTTAVTAWLQGYLRGAADMLTYSGLHGQLNDGAMQAGEIAHALDATRRLMGKEAETLAPGIDLYCRQQPTRDMNAAASDLLIHVVRASKQ